MTTQPRSKEGREIEAAARRYKRDGYKVIRPDRSRERPSFLGDLVPDLIAERDDDKVVIEVKHAESVRGANEIVELAERIARQPGWRFELIALRSGGDKLRPDLSWGDDTVSSLVAQGFLKAAFIVVCAMIENVLAFLAFQKNIRPASVSPADVLKALVVKGIIDEEARDKVRDARAKRNALMHDPEEPIPAKADIQALIQLGRALQGDVLASDAPTEAAE